MAETTEPTRAALENLRGCRDALHGMERGLSAVVTARERDFLALGEDLMAVQSGCAELSGKAQELVDLSSGQAMLATLERLSGELRALTDRSASDAGRQSLEHIAGVSRIVEELAGIVAAFAKIVKKLTMLGIATRIESARLGGDGRGFSTLADDVEKLAHSIVDHCAGIATKIEALRGHVASARQRTEDSIKAQGRCFDAVTGGLAANITSLKDLSGRSAELSRHLSATAADIAADISQAVQSLQFHDIVRQQIEHVEQSLGEVAATLDEKSTVTENPLELLGFASDVLTLQTSQLDSAARHFSEAATTLRATLDSLGERIAGMGAAIAALPGRGDGDNPLTGVEAGVAMVKRELGDFAAQGEALGGIMDAVASTIADMGQSIAAIEEVGEEIELIAINASIKAAHTGDAGAALGVLATAIQHLSVDARHQTDAVSRILGDMSQASGVLQENARRYNDQSEAWRVVGELDPVLADLAGAVSRSGDLFSALEQASASYGAQARTVGRGIDFDRDLTARLSALEQTLQRQVDAAKPLVTQGGAARGARLRELYDRYTMEAERAVHEAAFGLAPASRPTASEPLASSESGEFGDNVELF